MNFILPCNPLNPSRVDPDFKKEYNSISSLGFKVCLFDHDQFISSGKISDFSFTPYESNESVTEDVILRSWMLSDDQYSKFYEILKSRGIELINTPLQYSNCHYYPNAHDSISSFAPKSIWFEDLSRESIISHRHQMGIIDMIVKDYVKSDKGSDGIFKLDASLSDDEFCDKIIQFKESRYSSFNKGIVLKEFLNYKKYVNKTNEFRIFVLNYEIISMSQNTGFGGGTIPDVNFLKPLIKKIDSNYFSIDIAELSNGKWIIVECGDGCVSGLSPNQNELIYYMNFHNLQKDVI